MTYSAIQAWFHSGYSTLTNVLTLNHQIECEAGSHIVFLDFASAFDCVQWSYLHKELEMQDINPLVLQLIYHLMYRDMSFSVIANGCQSSEQSHTTGLPQGSPLSRTPFNRFIDNLLSTLNWQNATSFSSALCQENVFWWTKVVLNAPGPPPSTMVLPVPLAHSWSTLILPGSPRVTTVWKLRTKVWSRWTRGTTGTMELGVGRGALWSCFYILLMFSLPMIVY